MPSAIDLLASSPVFHDAPSPRAILDADFRFRAVNATFEATSGHSRALLLGERVFDLFPDNPANPKADGVARMAASLEWVLHEGRPHRMPSQRHDIPDPSTPNRFTYKIWAPLNRPVRDARGRTVAVLHQTEDVTDLFASGMDSPETAGAAVRALLHEHEASVFLRNQVDTLSEALETNRLISTAVGLIMAVHGVSREAAFDWLVTSSQKQHRKLRDVADDLVNSCEARADR